METFKCYTCGGIFPGTLAPFATKCNICTQTQILQDQLFEQSQRFDIEPSQMSGYSGDSGNLTRNEIILWWVIFITLSTPGLYWVYFC